MDGATVGVGRVGGVPVRLHWSVLVIMALIALGVSPTRRSPRPIPAGPVCSTRCSGSPPAASACSACWRTRSPTRSSHDARGSRSRASRCGCSAVSRGWRERPTTPRGTPHRRVGPLVSMLLGLAFGAGGRSARRWGDRPDARRADLAGRDQHPHRPLQRPPGRATRRWPTAAGGALEVAGGPKGGRVAVARGTGTRPGAHRRWDWPRSLP